MHHRISAERSIRLAATGPAGLLLALAACLAQPAACLAEPMRVAPARATEPTVPAASQAPERPSTAAVKGTHGSVVEGRIAYYGARFAGRKTANGERFDPEAMTMAHRSLPFGTMVRVTNPRNDRSVVVRVNDRGPVAPGRVADVTIAAARKLDMVSAGVIEARLEVIEPPRRKDDDRGEAS